MRKTPAWKTITTTFFDIGQMIATTEAGDGTAPFPKEKYVISQMDNIRRMQNNTSASLNTGFFFLNELQSHYKTISESEEAIPALLPKDFVGIGVPCNSIASVDTFNGPREGPQIASSVSLANIPECDREVFNVIPGQGSFSSMTPERGGEGWSVIMLFCTYNCQQDDVDEYLQFLKKEHPKAEVIGGFVAGRSGIIIEKGKLKRCGHILGMAIGGNVVYSSQVSRACKKISEVLTIQVRSCG